MPTFTERLELLITGTSTSAVAALEKTAGKTEELTLAQKASKLATQGTTSALQALGVPAEATGAALKVAAGAAGAFAAIKVGEAAYGAAQAFAGLTGEVRAFQRVSGASAEDSSRLVFAVRELGIQPDAAASAFGRFATRLGNNKDLLSEYGVEVAKNHDGTTDLVGTVENLSAAYQAQEDPTKKAALANAAFGRSWQTLAPLLSKGKDDLAEIFKFAGTSNQVFSADQLEAGRQFTIATRQLDEAMQGLKIEVGAAVAPVFTEFANTATTVVTGLDKAGSAVGGFGNIVKSGIDTVNPFNNVMHGIATVSDLAQGHFVDAAGNFAKSLPGIGNAITGITDLFGGASDASETYAGTQKDVQEAQQKVADLLVAGKAGTQEYRDAVADANEKSDAYAKTTQQLANALQDETEKTFAATQQHLALASANLNVEASMLNVKQALDNQAKAQTDANNAAQFGVDQSDDVEAAEIKTQQAILGVIDAAQKRAVQAAGPSASTEAQHKAAVDATTLALENMAATVPGTITELQKLGYQVLTLPNGEIVVTANTTQAEQQLAALQQQIASFLQFANQPGNFGPFGTGASARSVGAPAPPAIPGPRSVAAAAPGAVGVSAMAAPRAIASAAPVVNLSVNVSTTGLGADAPEIQRAVVEAVRGYVNRNGRLVGIA